LSILCKLGTLIDWVWTQISLGENGKKNTKAWVQQWTLARNFFFFFFLFQFCDYLNFGCFVSSNSIYIKHDAVIIFSITLTQHFFLNPFASMFLFFTIILLLLPLPHIQIFQFLFLNYLPEYVWLSKRRCCFLVGFFTREKFPHYTLFNSIPIPTNNTETMMIPRRPLLSSLWFYSKDPSSICSQNKP